METDSEQLINNNGGNGSRESLENEVPSVQISTKRSFRITIEPVLGAVFLAQCLSGTHPFILTMHYRIGIAPTYLPTKRFRYSCVCFQGAGKFNEPLL